MTTSALGAPTITGTASMGAELTSDTTSTPEGDGLDDVTFNHQWLAVYKQFRTQRVPVILWLPPTK